MSDQIDQILSSIDTLEIARIKGGLFKMVLSEVLKQKGVRGVDWHPQKVVEDVENSIKTVMSMNHATTNTMSMIARHVQDALSEFRIEVREMIGT